MRAEPRASPSARAAVEALARQATAKPAWAPRAKPGQIAIAMLRCAVAVPCQLRVRPAAAKPQLAVSAVAPGMPDAAGLSSRVRMPGQEQAGGGSCKPWGRGLLGTTGARAGNATKAAPAARAATAAMEETARRGMAASCTAMQGASEAAGRPLGQRGREQSRKRLKEYRARQLPKALACQRRLWDRSMR